MNNQNQTDEIRQLFNEKAIISAKLILSRLQSTLKVYVEVNLLTPCLAQQIYTDAASGLKVVEKILDKELEA